MRIISELTERKKNIFLGGPKPEKSMSVCCTTVNSPTRNCCLYMILDLRLDVLQLH